MNEPSEDYAHAHIRFARSRLELLTVKTPVEDEIYINEQLVAAATELADGRDVLAEWRDACRARRTVPITRRDHPQRTLDVLTAYEATPEAKHFELIIAGLPYSRPRRGPRRLIVPPPWKSTHSLMTKCAITITDEHVVFYLDK